MPTTLNRSAEHARQRRYWEQAATGRRSPDHPVVRAIFEPRADYIASLLPDPSGGAALDVGCGNGFMTAPLRARFGYVVGIDLSAEMLRANPCRRRVRATAVTLPFHDDEFDIVTCSHLLHHMVANDRIQAVREMLRVARRYVVIYEPNRNNPLMFALGCVKKVERMSLAFHRSYVGGLLRRCGAKDVQTTVGGLLVPNRAPVAAVDILKPLERTPLDALGFYIRAVARP